MNDEESCPGCGCSSGDEVTSTCNHPDGCGYFKDLDIVREIEKQHQESKGKSTMNTPTIKDLAKAYISSSQAFDKAQSTKLWAHSALKRALEPYESSGPWIVDGVLLQYINGALTITSIEPTFPDEGDNRLDEGDNRLD